MCESTGWEKCWRTTEDLERGQGCQGQEAPTVAQKISQLSDIWEERMEPYRDVGEERSEQQLEGPEAIGEKQGRGWRGGRVLGKGELMWTVGNGPRGKASPESVHGHGSTTENWEQ